MELVISGTAGLLSVILAVFLYSYIKKQDEGTPKMKEIASAIREGAKAYLKRQNMYLAVFVVVMASILGTLLGFHVAIAYIFGSFCTTLASYFGMSAAVKTNVRVANAARKGLSKAFPVAFYGGAIMGFCIVGMALLGITIVYFSFSRFSSHEIALESVLGFSFGASALALFAKAGGGIYTKTADIGADLVGKVELGIPEDDPRNPAVIADNVGDNVGDVAGMGADLIDSYIASIVAAMVIGATISLKFALLPLLIAAAGIFASLIGILFVRVKEKESPGKGLNRGTFSTCVIFAVLTFSILYFMDLGQKTYGIFLPTLAGLLAGAVMGITTDYYTSIDRNPVKKTAESAKTGAATTILSGISYGIISIVPSIVGIAVATIAAWYLSAYYGVNSFYGISVAAVGMLSIVGMIISADAYGPIVDNSRGIVEQSKLGEKVLKITDKLDAAGNTAKAITKGFAIGAAALTVLALFGTYAEVVGIEKDVNGMYVINIVNPKVIAGLFIGAMMPPLLSALLILGVGKNAFRMIEEVRRQFKEIPGLIKGKAKPDYAKCVDIATKGALKELMLPCSLAIIVPLIVGFTLGKEALAGFLAGSIVTGIIFALFMANSGGAWDNAKKFIEEGNFGGKGSDAHKAAVVGDTVGDPFKDTAGPSLNTMITVMSLVSSVFAPLIVSYALIF
ncbi:MAG: sodium-translocating pyrophosphatase [Candidatus Aenigmarchaeota archaeon]|nr:sodium-translocating pyrophosphatase [Candidatus Aenigmarchaeota archaeon]